MTDSEIVRALEICGTYKGKCTDCPAFVKVDRSNCKQVLLGAVEIINRLQAENKDKDILLNHQGEVIKMLENVIKNTFLENAGLDIDPLAEIKAEAYKECIEKVKEYIDTYEHLACKECECVPISKDGLDNFLKEKVGADNANSSNY